MELTIRILMYAVVAFALLAANLWFFRSIYVDFFGTEYVILPFNVIDPSDQASVERKGEALAQMMAARLSNIQSELRGTQTVEEPELPQSDLSNPLAVTALFISRPVDVPTSLFTPITIQASVGGVEVGGIIAWFHRLVATEHAIRITTYERANGAVITADLSDFAPSVGHVWFESEKHLDEIATNAAYALIQSKLAEKGSGRIEELELADFRSLLENIFQVNSLNRRALRGYIVATGFGTVLPSIETQIEKVPGWPELIYLTGSVAEGAGNVGKAVVYYRQLQVLTDKQKQGADVRVIDWARDRLAALGAAGQQLTDERQAKFVSTASEFARVMGLSGSDPQIVFVEHPQSGVQALWNSSARRYEVSPSSVDTAGVAQHVALMGRFLDRHFDQCFGSDVETPKISTEFWNEFRYSVVDYLIQTQPDFKQVQNLGMRYKLYDALKEIDAVGGSEPTKRLALALLERFECDWTREVIAHRIVEINHQAGLMPDKTILQAMAHHGFPVP